MHSQHVSPLCNKMIPILILATVPAIMLALLPKALQLLLMT